MTAKGVFLFALGRPARHERRAKCNFDKWC